MYEVNVLPVAGSGTEAPLDGLASRHFKAEFLQEWSGAVDAPYFDPSTPTNITGLVGHPVRLLCRVKNLQNRTRYPKAEIRRLAAEIQSRRYNVEEIVLTVIRDRHEIRTSPLWPLPALYLRLASEIGDRSTLKCPLKASADGVAYRWARRPVSWVRHRDIHLLTVGRYTYTSDQRFEAQHKPRSEEWALRIRSPQRRDSGQYECQISTTPPIGHAVYLNIVVPLADHTPSAWTFETTRRLCRVSAQTDIPQVVRRIHFQKSRQIL
ncbi:Zwei Ig domain protein zig-8 [Eumeta japonica]|uniref:Zwei Ig domain protein zig-8 n=1 Tax=Eumeta variegata TaxID=151549 RepID=A0A4C1W902_EUMVA|nr:Zwei Ig domain protein zig-8 [Eumeta japonica]